MVVTKLKNFHSVMDHPNALSHKRVSSWDG